MGLFHCGWKSKCTSTEFSVPAGVECDTEEADVGQRDEERGEAEGRGGQVQSYR